MLDTGETLNRLLTLNDDAIAEDTFDKDVSVIRSRTTGVPQQKINGLRKIKADMIHCAHRTKTLGSL